MSGLNSKNLIVIRRGGVYLLFFSLCLIVVSLVVSWLVERSDTQNHLGSTELPYKYSYYLQHAGEFDTLFLGDSRTLTNIQPDQLDPLLGTQSFNLAHWANWFVTQYALLDDIIDGIPLNTTVIWSIGRQNFNKSYINPVYPIGWNRISYFAGIGQDWRQLIKAELAFTPATMLYVRKDEAFAKIQRLMKSPVFRVGQVQESKEVGSDFDTLQSFHNQGVVAFIKPWYGEKGNLVSVAQYKKNGSALRTEIEPAYYRARQILKNEHREDVRTYVANPSQWTLFVAMLDLFKARGIKLIVNEFEQAPWAYEPIESKEVFRRFMRETVQQKVESYGFPYILVDYDQFGNDDYFDHNHMNSAGVDKFNPEFVRAMLRVLAKRHQDAV